MRFQIGKKNYRVGHRTRFAAFVAVLMILCVLTGYALSGAASEKLCHQSDVQVSQMRSLNRISTVLTGNR